MLVDCTWGMSEGRRTRMSIVEKGGEGEDNRGTIGLLGGKGQ